MRSEIRNDVVEMKEDDLSGYSKFEPGFIIFLGDTKCSICETLIINFNNGKKKKKEKRYQI